MYRILVKTGPPASGLVDCNLRQIWLQLDRRSWDGRVDLVGLQHVVELLWTRVARWTAPLGPHRELAEVRQNMRLKTNVVDWCSP